MTLLSNKKPEKKLLLFLKKKGGRSSSGRISVRHRGGGARRFYRIIDFGQQKQGVSGKIVALEYDPNRAAYLALVQYQDNERSYILAPHGLKDGDEIICQENAEIKTGNRLKLKNIPVGTEICNVELAPQRGGKLSRAAGTFAKVLAHEGQLCHLALSSGETRKVLGECFATVGHISNPEHRFEKIGKAGRKRLMGWRPTVRGTAMNPPDHPHGGGEGKTTTGLKYPKTPWGKPARGVKTRKKKWTDKYIIKRRKS